MSLPTVSSDHAALVTGASSGIGTEIARVLARRGRNVVLVARRGDTLEEIAQELRPGGTRVEVLPTDLSDRQARAELPDRLAELSLGVDVLVNNAGFSTVGPVHRSDPAAELNMVEVDVAAVVDLCSRFLPAMVGRRSGAVLNVASTASFQPLPGQAAYGASKAFVLSYSRALSGELRGTGVTVTTLCPGPVHTGFVEVAGFDEKEATESMPSFMWETAEAVATAGVDGLDRGQSVVIPGRANQALALAARLTPKQLLVPILASRHPGLKDR